MKNVIIYTLNYCPFCKKALDFFKEKNINFEEIDVTYDEENMTEKIKNMFKLEKEVTFPQIIIDKQNIGGYSDLMKLEQEGQLSKLLEL
ncbi:glutathione S-transferase N-terminal domain-containing protein [bacterium]|nr:glutathione S-transferase N-terminal domain-containing protein [bacterium]